MKRSNFRRNAAVFALGLAFAGPAGAEDPAGVEEKNAAHGIRGSAIELVRRVLNLQQQEDVVSHAISVSNREASLELETAGGRSRSMSLRGGRIMIDGAVAGRYTSGGALDRSWRRLLADGAELETRAFLVSLRAWRVTGLAGDDLAAKALIDEAVRVIGSPSASKAEAAGIARADTVRVVDSRVAIRLRDLEELDEVQRQLAALDDLSPEVAAAVQAADMRLGNVTVAAGERFEGDLIVYRGTADVHGHVTGNVVSLYGDVAYHTGAVIDRSAVSVGGTVLDRGGTVRGDIRTISEGALDEALDVAALKAAEDAPPRSAFDNVFHDVRNVVAVFVAFAMLGFGTVFFGRRYLEVVADTATHSFGRSFVVGLLGQLLLLPTFAMLCVGLVFTVVGILLLPFAAAAYVIGSILALVGGYLAIAHAIGETFSRRRMANGAFVRAPNAYGYLFTGLVGLLGLWAAAALTGWMGPVVVLFKVAAVIVTWLAATAGFGAVLLSRAGLREAFAGRHFGEMSDEYLWATPPATPTAARMKQEK